MISETLVKLDNLTLDYSVRQGVFSTFKHRALDKVSFDIRKGETLGVIGSNGSGKSSLLLLLAGIIAPTSGGVIVSPGVTRSLLTLGLGFRADLTGKDNAITSLVLQGKSNTSAREHLPAIQEYAELGDFFDQPVRTYSAGMRARLGFATAISSSVDLLLVDELLSVGDANFRHKAEESMTSKLLGDQTVVFVSHSMSQVLNLCERTVWLEAGKVVAIGTSCETIRAYNKG